MQMAEFLMPVPLQTSRARSRTVQQLSSRLSAEASMREALPSQNLTIGPLELPPSAITVHHTHGSAGKPSGLKGSVKTLPASPLSGGHDACPRWCGGHACR